MKDIPGYDMYSINENGDIYSKFYNRNLNPSKNTGGYLQVRLSNGNSYKIFRIHRLVASIFLGDSDMEVNHIDGNKLNNHYTNLEYTTRSENVKHSYDTGLKQPSRPWLGRKGADNYFSKPIKAIGENCGLNFPSTKEAGEYFGVCANTIRYNILKEKLFHGYKLEYASS